jgi:hypothetical protein
MFLKMSGNEWWEVRRRAREGRKVESTFGELGLKLASHEKTKLFAFCQWVEGMQAGEELSSTETGMSSSRSKTSRSRRSVFEVLTSNGLLHLSLCFKIFNAAPLQN